MNNFSKERQEEKFTDLLLCGLNLWMLFFCLFLPEWRRDSSFVLESPSSVFHLCYLFLFPVIPLWSAATISTMAGLQVTWVFTASQLAENSCFCQCNQFKNQSTIENRSFFFLKHTCSLSVQLYRCCSRFFCFCFKWNWFSLWWRLFTVLIHFLRINKTTANRCTEWERWLHVYFRVNSLLAEACAEGLAAMGCRDLEDGLYGKNVDKRA